MPKKKETERGKQVTKAADEYHKKMFDAPSKGRKHLTSFVGMTKDRLKKLIE